jgi:membrane-associated phospholipid phosphatase
MSKSPVLVLFLSLFSLAVFAQDTTTVTKDTAYHFSTGQYLKSYWTNGTQLLVSPLHWSGKSWAIAGSTVAVTTGLYLLDDEINKPFSRWQSLFGKSFGKTGNALGQSFFLGSSVVLLGTGIVSKSSKLTAFAEDNLQAQLFTDAICLVAKQAFGRSAPGAAKGATYFTGPFPPKGYTSFFSGHSSLAFATATTIFLHSGKKWWVGLLSYSIASGIAVSRMQYQHHWSSDVFFGSVVGTAVSSFVYHQNQRHRQMPIRKRLL